MNSTDLPPVVGVSLPGVDLIAAQRWGFHGYEEGAFDFVPLRDMVICQSAADGHRHWIARLALVDHLRGDPRFVRMLLDWLADNDIAAKVFAYADTMDAYAQHAGLPDRQHCWTDDAKRQISQFDDELPEDERAHLGNSIRKAEQDFMRAVDAGRDDLTTRVTALVRGEFGLPWPWLVFDLVMECITILSRYVVGCEVVTAIKLVFADPPAPKIRLGFATRRGERLGQLRARLAEAFGRLDDQLREVAEEGLVTRGRPPDDDVTRRQARWFYRNRLCGQSINSIHLQDLYDRATILHGVREAERLLSLSPFRYEQAPGEDGTTKMVR